MTLLQTFRRYFRRRSNIKLIALLLFIIGLVKVVIVKNEGMSEAAILQYRMKRYLAYQTRPPREGPGENGAPVTLSPDEEKLAEQKWKNASFNVVASDKIAMDRSIPDTRRKE